MYDHKNAQRIIEASWKENKSSIYKCEEFRGKVL